MQRFVIIASLLFGVSLFAGEPLVEPFEIRPTLAVKVDYLTGARDSSITKHAKDGEADSISAVIRDDRGLDEGTAGMIIRFSSPEGKLLWKHNFGFDYSTLPAGNRVSVTSHPDLPLILIHNHGYKASSSSKLLFIENDTKGAIVRDYITADKDLLPKLKTQEGFPADYKYRLSPEIFNDEGIVFSCIPIQKRELQAPHPFAQDQPWYKIVGKIGKDFHMRQPKPLMLDKDSSISPSKPASIRTW